MNALSELELIVGRDSYIITLYDEAAHNRLNNFKNLKDYGAIGDGTTDDSAAFADCFNNERLIIIPPGTYKINCNLTGSHKTIIGYGATIKTDNNLYFHDFEDITIIGLEIDGMSTASIPLYFKIGHHAKVVDCEVHHGAIICLQFSTVDGVTVDGCTLHDTTDANNSNTVLAFNVPIGDPSGYEELGSIVTNCEVYGGGLDAIIANMHYITISNCSLHDNGWRDTAAGIYANSKFNHAYNGNLIYKNTGNGVDLFNCGNATCDGNYVSENLCAGILYSQAHSGSISDNICNNNGSQAIVPEQSGGVSIGDGCDGVIISHNTIALNNYGVITSGTNTDTILDGNIIKSNTVADIQASSDYKIADYTTVTV